MTRRERGRTVAAEEVIMEFVVPTIEELGYGLRALKTLGLSDGALHETERDVMTAVQAMFGDTRPIDAIEPITPEELARGIASPATRKQLFGGMIVMCMADGEIAADEARAVAAFGAALDIDDASIANLARIAKGQLLRARLDILRRQWAVRKIRAMAEEQGVGVYFKAILGLLAVREDSETVARFRAFEKYPAGSLGRGYYDYMIANGFSFPGEKGAPPEAMLFHDLTHVLSGYRTTPGDEILTATFSAGYSTHEVHNWFMFVLSQFQLGHPTAPGVKPEVMQLDPRRMLVAYRRGTAVNRDLNEGWDPWPVLDRPLEAVRAELNVLPESHFEAL
jgi:hypothetical protein